MCNIYAGDDIIKRAHKYAITIICALFVLFIFLYPKEIILSAKTGLLLWYNSVLPSIFPFLAASNILVYIGAVVKMGKFLTPVTKPLFNIPGSGAFALLMGGISGYPIGAKITADLRSGGKLSKTEAQRLICFCNNPGPLFVVGAVGTSMLGSAKAGYFILLTNYLAALIVGVIVRFYKKAPLEEGRFIYVASSNEQTFGKVLSSAIANAIESILQIGGFIVIFSVVITIFGLSGVLNVLAELIEPLLQLLNLSPLLCSGFSAGLVEMTNGIKIMAESGAPFKQIVILSGVLASFGGFSIYAQTAGFISKTDINAVLYLISKVIQCIIQAFIAVIMYDFVFI